MKDWLTEQKHRIVDRFYFWFGTYEYYHNRKEPVLLYGKWVCHSVQWQMFDTFKEAEEALKKIGKNVV